MNNFKILKEKKSFVSSILSGLWFEYRALKQNSSIVYSNLLFPIVYYIFFVKGLSKTIGEIQYSGKYVSYDLYALTGLMGIICVGEITNVIYRTVIDNKWGLLHLKLINGIDIFSYSISKSFYAIVGIHIQIPVLLVLAKLSNNISYFNLFVGYIMILFITLFWVNLGIFLSLKITSYKMRDLIIRLSLLPIYFSAPSYYILDDVDKLIKYVSYINPLTYQLKGLREAMFFLNYNKDVYIVIFMTLIMFLINFLVIKNVKFVRNEI